MMASSAARDAYRRAIELDPNFGPAFADLAMVEYLAVKRLLKTRTNRMSSCQAMDHADHAVALGPGRWQKHTRIARCCDLPST